MQGIDRDIVNWRERLAEQWVVPTRADAPPRRDPVVLVAVVSAWNEADVIYSTVHHLFEQGCDRVVVLDDRSDDGTGDEARLAGAEVVGVSTGSAYSEPLRASLLGSAVRRLGVEVGCEAWFLILDADELPVGRAGRCTVRDVVAGAPSDVDVIGADFVGHVPRVGGTYAPRVSPLEQLPMAVPHVDPYCPSGHCKHPLFRLSDPDDLRTSPGQHIVLASDRRPLVEHSEPLLIHHFPVRGRASTERRLRTLLEPGGRYANSPEDYLRWHLGRRLAMLDALFEGDYERVPSGVTPSEPGVGVRPVHWKDLIDDGRPPTDG